MAEILKGDRFDLVEFDFILDRVSYSPEVRVECSIGEKVFVGELLIEFEGCTTVLEYMSFEGWLREEVEAKPTTIEEATRMIFDEVVRALGDIPVRVLMRATTAVHAPVTVEIKSKLWRLRDGQKYDSHGGSARWWLRRSSTYSGRGSNPSGSGR
jgi:hypothetical protein